MTTTPSRIHPLHESIRKHKIRRVAVVDDGFDAVSVESFDEGEDQEFIAAINEDDALLRQFHALVSGSELDDLIGKSDLTDAAVNRLWESRANPGDLSTLLSKTLFRVLGLKVFQVEQLCVFLREVLGIEDVQPYGTSADIPKEKFDIAFIDYRFGPSKQAASVDRAVRWATDLYSNGGAFIILMSSETEARVRQEKFREDSKLTRGLFEFVDKKEITDAGKICNRLNSFCAGLKTRHAIHQFASAAEVAVDEAIAALKESIHSLGLEDYAYLEQISLREDGHPLGDYMLWLFGEYFGHRLAIDGSLQPARRELNSLKYEQLLPLQRPPSVMLASMYSAAITEPVHEGWGAHPRESKEAEETQVEDVIPIESAEILAPLDPPESNEPAEPTEPVEESAGIATSEKPIPSQNDEQALPAAAGMPLYQLGDLLVANKDKPVFLILNAGCDLQFSPGMRDCDPLQTILLLPGRLEPLHERGDEKNVKRTELFELGGDRFRIVWQHTRSVAIPYHKVQAEYQTQGYNRNFRLKLPYALEVQQHFAAQLTRVGVPTPTPVFRERPVNLYGTAEGGDAKLLRTIQNGAIVFHHRDRDQFVLTVDCVHEILDGIDKFSSSVEDELRVDQTAPPPTPDETKKVVRRKKYLAELHASREALANFCKFQSILSVLPAVNGNILQTEKPPNQPEIQRLEVRHVAEISGRYTGGAPIVVAISVPNKETPGLSNVDGSHPETSDDADVKSTREEQTQE